MILSLEKYIHIFRKQERLTKQVLSSAPARTCNVFMIMKAADHVLRFYFGEAECKVGTSPESPFLLAEGNAVYGTGAVYHGYLDNGDRNLNDAGSTSRGITALFARKIRSSFTKVQMAHRLARLRVPKTIVALTYKQAKPAVEVATSSTLASDPGISILFFQNKLPQAELS